MSNTTFNVGDLCTCQYDDRGGGLLYRVIEAYSNGQVKIKPVLGVLVSTRFRKTRTLHGNWCEKITRVELAQIVKELDNFIGIDATFDVTVPHPEA